MFKIVPLREFKFKYVPPDEQASFERTKDFIIFMALADGIILELAVVCALFYFGILPS